ncbi:Glycosyl transferase, family 19 like protein, partial [Aduncisulcus paluster]
KILCILPFEQQFFKDRGVDAQYVGHPLLDLMPLKELDAVDPDPNLIGILPGSRSKEISSLLPEFAAAAEKLSKDFPQLKFSIARAPGVKEEKLRHFWPDHLPVTINQPENRYRLMRNANAIMAASGTATLECALIGTPTLNATADNFYKQIHQWVNAPESAQKVRTDLKELREMIGEPGVAARTAKTILDDLNSI